MFGGVPHQIQDFVVLPDELYKVVFSQFLKSVKIPLMAAWTSGASVSTLTFESFVSLLRMQSILSSRLLHKLLNWTVPSTDPRSTALVTGLQIDHATNHYPLGLSA